MTPIAMTDRKAIDLALRHATAKGDVAGVVAMAATATDLLYSGCEGMADLATGRAMRPDSIFRLRSMTKAITAVAVMQLVERGMLSLDADMGTVLPALRTPMVVEGYSDGNVPTLRRAAGPVTLRHLLTHSSGYSNPAWNADLVRVTKALGLPPRPDTMDQLQRTPLLFDPGTRWSYSIGIDILGHVITAVSDLPIDVHLTRHVTGPLGMLDTTFTLTPAQRARLVTVHQRQANGSLVARDLPGGDGPEFLAAGGGLCSTAGDYLRFLRMFLNGGTLEGRRILAAETVADIGRNHLGEVDVVPMISVDPAISCDCDFFPGAAKKWGLAGLINSNPGPYGRAAGSFSWAGAMNTYFWLDPSAGIAGVLLSQSLPFADPKLLDLLGALERGVYGIRA